MSLRLTTRHCRPALLAGLLLVALAGPVLACRIIIPPEPIPRPVPPRPMLQPMQVRSHRASIDLTERFAKVHLEAVFYNPNGQRIEGTYVFPIAKDAAVSSFSMTVNGKTMEAELLPADKARSIYEGIVRSMRDPALLEYLDQGLLQARVFPIEPYKEVKIELNYEQKVSQDGGIGRLAYPLLSARPDQNGTLQSVAIDVTLETATPLKTVYVPGFDVRVDRPGNTKARISWEASNYRPEKDFEIVFSADKAKVGVDFLAYRKESQGYFVMFIAPNSELQAQEIAAKDITFVVDTSGSMSSDRKLEQTQQALRFCLKNLTKDDRFNVVSFATDVYPLAEASLPATPENIGKAVAFVDGLRARGGTAIDDALGFALSRESGDGVPMIVFLTDGLPTIGEVDPAAILKRAKDRLAARKTAPRIFTFGVGNDVNTKLLDGVAAEARGFTTYVRPKEDLELVLTSFFNKVASPVMTDLRLDTGDVRLLEMVPKTLPDLFRGEQLTVTGRYEGKGTVAMTLSGAVQDNREQFRFEASLDGDSRNAFIPRLWAITRVGQLQEQLALHGSNQELIDEIKRLGREYGILTPYTSFLVVEEGLAVHERQAARRDLEALEMSAGAADTGAGAVDMARARGEMKAAAPSATMPGGGAFGRHMAEAAPSANLSPERLQEIVVPAADKTFYKRHGDTHLYDAAIPANTTPKIDREVKAWSAEFFKLVDQYPQLRKYILAGPNLVIELGGQVIRISE